MIIYAHQVPPGSIFATPSGNRYRVKGRNASGVLAVPLRGEGPRRFTTGEGKEVVLPPTSGEAIVICEMTEVDHVEA